MDGSAEQELNEALNTRSRINVWLTCLGQTSEIRVLICSKRSRGAAQASVRRKDLGLERRTLKERKRAAVTPLSLLGASTNKRKCPALIASVAALLLLLYHHPRRRPADTKQQSGAAQSPRSLAGGRVTAPLCTATLAAPVALTSPPRRRCPCFRSRAASSKAACLYSRCAAPLFKSLRLLFKPRRPLVLARCPPALYFVLITVVTASIVNPLQAHQARHQTRLQASLLKRCLPSARAKSVSSSLLSTAFIVAVPQSSLGRALLSVLPRRSSSTALRLCTSSSFPLDVELFKRRSNHLHRVSSTPALSHNPRLPETHPLAARTRLAPAVPHAPSPPLPSRVPPQPCPPRAAPLVHPRL